jgi:hypothetical protein
MSAFGAYGTSDVRAVGFEIGQSAWGSKATLGRSAPEIARDEEVDVVWFWEVADTYQTGKPPMS